MKIDSNRLKKEISIKEHERLKNVPDDEKDIYISAYADGTTDVITLIIDQIEEQIKEGTNGAV